MYKNRSCMLMILDGWGISQNREGNAVFLAETPFLDRLKEEYPNTSLLCSGEAVGLPDGIIGNSEVGHLNIGAGRVVCQDLMKIDNAIKNGSFYTNNVFNSVLSRVADKKSAIHFLGLVSDGGVHSQMDHLFALIDMAADKGLTEIYIHAIMDGRDTPPDSGIRYITRLKEYIDKKKAGTIATICGRFYAMDRDSRWERVKKAYDLYVQGKGVYEKDPVKAVENAYSRDETDEFVKPVAIIDEAGKPVGTIKDGDGMIFFNFRADRAREITRALTENEFEAFKRKRFPKFSEYVCMTLYDENFNFPVAFPPSHMDKILGEVISSCGLNQFRIAETEKYAHVTYFFNGGEEKSFPHEDRCMVPSPREVSTYDEKPEMSAHQVAKEAISRIKSGKYSLIVLNFANMDMVGHTGILDAAIKACEAVDSCVKEIVECIMARGDMVVITADHGNAEMMTDKNGKPYTAHTLNPVPLILVDDTRKGVTLKHGSLQDIAPTMLDIMGIEKPGEMTGNSLIIV